MWEYLIVINTFLLSVDLSYQSGLVANNFTILRSMFLYNYPLTSCNQWPSSLWATLTVFKCHSDEEISSLAAWHSFTSLTPSWSWPPYIGWNTLLYDQKSINHNHIWSELCGLTWISSSYPSCNRILEPTHLHPWFSTFSVFSSSTWSPHVLSQVRTQMILNYL